MLNTLTLNQPLVSRFARNSKLSPFAIFALIVLGNALLAMASKISIPLIPVPATMQTFAVLFIGAAYGWRLAGATVLAYLVEGLSGLPVFAESAAGLPVFLGPTGGYLLGFFPAAIVTGYLIEQGFGRSILSAALAGFAGAAIILFCGACQLSNFIGLSQAIAVGIKPFLLIETIKVLLLAVITPIFWRK